MPVFALGAKPELAAGFRRTATDQIAKDPLVNSGYTIRETLYVRRAVAAENLGQTMHHRSLMKPAIFRAASEVALSVMWAYLDVVLGELWPSHSWIRRR